MFDLIILESVSQQDFLIVVWGRQCISLVARGRWALQCPVDSVTFLYLLYFYVLNRHVFGMPNRVLELPGLHGLWAHFRGMAFHSHQLSGPVWSQVHSSAFPASVFQMVRQC